LLEVIASSGHPLDHKILRNIEMMFESDVRNHLYISSYSGSAKNLRDPMFGEKSENFGKFGWCGVQI
jgi:hypothetical protein